MADRGRLRGTYHNLALFFDRISRFSRIINIENLKITQSRTRPAHDPRAFTAKTFVYQETEPPPAAAAKPARPPPEGWPK